MEELTEGDQIECAACSETSLLGWHPPGTGSHYCLRCIANRLRDVILGPAEPWPPECEGVPIPMEDQRLLDFLDTLQGQPVVVEECVEESGLPRETKTYLYAGLIASYREADRYRNVVKSARRRIFCTHPRLEDCDRPVTMLEPGTDTCDCFIGPQFPFRENEPHTWTECRWCHRYVCQKCGRPQSNSIPAATEDSTCTQTADMIENGDIENEGRGAWYQRCPDPECRREGWRVDGCNQMTCPCGTRYCFICGTRLPADEGADGHFRPGAPCPRFGQPGDPKAIHDAEIPLQNSQWEFAASRLDLENYDAVGFEPSSYASVSELWQMAAAVLSGEPFDVAFPLPQVDNPADRDWFRTWMARLMVASRHMLAMIANGLEYGGSTTAAREACVMRRIRFAHHALTFSFVWSRVMLHFGNGIMLPGGQMSYDLLPPYSRALRFQQGAVPESMPTRDQEWDRFYEIVEDQLNVQYPTAYLLDAAASGAHHLRRAVWIRALLEPVRAMLPIIRRHGPVITRPFSLPDSATLRSPMNELQERIQALREQPSGTAAFILHDAEQRTVFRIADLFASHLLEDEPDPVVQPPALSYAQEPDNMLSENAFNEIWCDGILNEIDADTISMNRRTIDEMPRRVYELYRTLSALGAAARTFNTRPRPSREICDHHLLNLRRIVQRHSVNLGDPAEAGNRDWRLNPPDGPLRAIFYRAYISLTVLDDELQAFQPSARSSINSLMDTSIGDDRAFVEEQLLTCLELARSEVDGRPRRSFLVEVLSRFREVLLMMHDPDQYPQAISRESFSWLWNQYRRSQLDMLEVEGLNAADDEEWRRIAQVLARRMPEAAQIAEINPHGEMERMYMNSLTERLREVEGAVEGLSDTLYIRALQTQIDHFQWLWTSSDLPLPDMLALREFLGALSNASDFEALPSGFQEGEPAHKARERYRRSIRRLRINATVIGDLDEYPRLRPIIQRVKTWLQNDSGSSSSDEEEDAA